MIAVDTTTTEKRMRINDSDDFIMQIAFFRQLFFVKGPSSIVGDGGDEGPSNDTEAASSVFEILETIVAYTTLRKTILSLSCGLVKRNLMTNEWQA